MPPPLRGGAITETTRARPHPPRTATGSHPLLPQLSGRLEAAAGTPPPAPRPCAPAPLHPCELRLQLGGKLRAFQPACGTHSPNRKEPVEREMWSDNRCSRKRGKKLLLKWQ